MLLTPARWAAPVFWCTTQDTLTIYDAFIDPTVVGAAVGTVFQFERIGFFAVDKDTSDDLVRELPSRNIFAPAAFCTSPRIHRKRINSMPCNNKSTSLRTDAILEFLTSPCASDGVQLDGDPEGIAHKPWCGVMARCQGLHVRVINLLIVSVGSESAREGARERKGGSRSALICSMCSTLSLHQ